MTLKCSLCGHENHAGDDRCSQCLHSLMQRDLPRPKKDDSIQRTLMTTPISELITGKDLLVAAPDDSVQKVIDILRREGKDCVLIYKKHHLVGILSYRDLLFKVAGRYQDLSKVTAKEVMTQSPEYVKADAPIAYIVNKMSIGGYRHVPILAEDETPLSIVNINDILSFISSRSKSA